MNEIHVAVRNGTAFQTDHRPYTAGDGETWVVFDLEEGWADYPAKVARFQTENGYQDVMFRGEKCHVPQFPYAQKLEVGLYAGNLRTTTPARLFVRPGIRSAWGPPADPEPNVFDQLLDCFGESDLDMETTEEGVRLTVRYRGGEKTAFLRHSEVYVGSGEMPEGYRIQLDPSGGTAILRVKDLNGDLIPIPSIRGEKGDKGETGRPGRDGRDGTCTVNGREPDSSGSITLLPEDLGALPAEGGSMSGKLLMGGNQVRELGEPTRDTDAASKGYVDGKRKCILSQLDTAWTGTGPYTQTLYLLGIQKTDTPHVVPVYGEEAEAARSIQKAWQCVSFANAGDAKIVFICLDQKPDTAIPIQIEVIS